MNIRWMIKLRILIEKIVHIIFYLMYHLVAVPLIRLIKKALDSFIYNLYYHLLFILYPEITCYFKKLITRFYTCSLTHQLHFNTLN